MNRARLREMREVILFNKVELRAGLLESQSNNKFALRLDNVTNFILW